MWVGVGVAVGTGVGVRTGMGEGEGVEAGIGTGASVGASVEIGGNIGNLREGVGVWIGAATGAGVADGRTCKVSDAEVSGCEAGAEPATESVPASAQAKRVSAATMRTMQRPRPGPRVRLEFVSIGSQLCHCWT